MNAHITPAENEELYEVAQAVLASTSPGGPAIARQLVLTGTCVVAGTEPAMARLWVDRTVLEWIECTPAENAVGCTMVRLKPGFFASDTFIKSVEALVDRRAKFVERETTRLADLRSVVAKIRPPAPPPTPADVFT